LAFIWVKWETNHLLEREAMKGSSKFLQGAKIGGKGPGLKLKGDYKADTFGKKVTKAPKKALKA
jgi:hypothetical protein